MNAEQLETILKNATTDTIVHLEYDAFRHATVAAIEAAEAASDWNKPSNHYVGNFEAIRTAKNGDTILVLFVHNRGEHGAFRSFNVDRGIVRAITVEAA